MKTTDYIIDCKVLCYSTTEEEKKEKADRLGIPYEENSQAWFPCAFDLREVIAVRLPADSKEETREEECVVYFQFEHFTIDQPFKEMREKWIKLMSI